MSKRKCVECKKDLIAGEKNAATTVRCGGRRRGRRLVGALLQLLVSGWLRYV